MAVNWRLGLLRAGRAVAVGYWATAGVAAWSAATGAGRQYESAWQVEADGRQFSAYAFTYTEALTKAQSYARAHPLTVSMLLAQQNAAPEPVDIGDPWEIAATRWDSDAASRAAGQVVGAGLAAFLVGWAIWRALRWIIEGFAANSDARS